MGAKFYLQIERCAGVAAGSCSVRLEEDWHLSKAIGSHRGPLKGALPSEGQGLEGCDRQVLRGCHRGKALKEKSLKNGCEVCILDVPTLYALEVRVMKQEPVGPRPHTRPSSPAFWQPFRSKIRHAEAPRRL